MADFKMGFNFAFEQLLAVSTHDTSQPLYNTIVWVQAIFPVSYPNHAKI